MDRDQAKRYVKGQLEPYLAQKGLNTKKPFHCLNPAHGDKNPSMSFDRRRNKVHCFACGADYDIFDVVGLDHGLTDPREAFEKTYDLFEVDRPAARASAPKPALKRIHIDADASPAEKPSPTGGRDAPGPARGKDFSRYFQKVQAQLAATDYHLRRGLSPATCRRFGLGFDPNFPTGPNGNWAAFIIPTGPGSFTARNTDPAADKSARIRKRGASPVFNAEALWSSGGQDPPAKTPAGRRPLFVVEGEIDALSLYEVGAEAVALGSCANVGAFLKLVETRPPVRPLLLALDADPEGLRAAELLAAGLAALKISFHQADILAGHKDPGEALLRDRTAFAQAVGAAERIEEEIQALAQADYLATSAFHHLAAFKGAIARSVHTPHQPTGFAGLDRHLGGGLFEGLYIMGGISSLGKTSLALQLADQLARSGQDVLIFSLEMARSELMAKSLSRLTLGGALARGLSSSRAKTARGITCGDRYEHYDETERRLIDAALEEYESFARHIFISEGVGDIGAAEIRRTVERHLAATGRAPVVLVDYLQIMAPHSDRSTDKQNTDKNVLELKRLSRDFKLPVLGLSSFNRANYREAVTMEAFKESGAIEYSSDVLIGLQLKGAGEKNFDAAEAREKNPREVELVILKNRHGPAGKKISFDYYPLFNYFIESSAQDGRP